ncbi:class I SAM-dependent methyltransferase [Synechococcus sp. N19]|uniref:class I SAM-dependent methyltransferase n=1 Tax=Synechococcus sp. N19 TaxID=2575512 RepID=UPI0010BED6E5|nr:class I SAM-dependent methyltransferase [Synechococcus sp. N19]
MTSEETQNFLDFVDHELDLQNFSLDSWKEYLKRLPTVYNNDVTFRLLFDWHWNLALKQGRAGVRLPSVHLEVSIFTKQVELIQAVGEYFYHLTYQYRELILFHARTNVRNKSLLEIGGSLPNDLLFDHLGVRSYINIESPDYIDARSSIDMSLGGTITSKHGEHERRRTIFCNAEDIGEHVLPESIDHIFSVACFEHIYDLPAALQACYACNKFGGTLYSYFAPIYSCITGDHGSIPTHDKFQEKPHGLHLLTPVDQRKKLIKAGIKDPMEIQNFLGKVNFDRVPNRLLYDDYERICTESLYYVLELDRQDDYNLSKVFPRQFAEVRRSNLNINNMMTSGFRINLLKLQALQHIM